jgi:hypothetical protein
MSSAEHLSRDKYKELRERVARAIDPDLRPDADSLLAAERLIDGGFIDVDSFEFDVY